MGRKQQMDFQVHVTLPVTLDKHGCDTTAAGWTRDAPPELTGLSCAVCCHFPDGCSCLSLCQAASSNGVTKPHGHREPWCLGTLAVTHPTRHREVGDKLQSRSACSVDGWAAG